MNFRIKKKLMLWVSGFFSNAGIWWKDDLSLVFFEETGRVVLQPHKKQKKKKR